VSPIAFTNRLRRVMGLLPTGIAIVECVVCVF